MKQKLIPLSDKFQNKRSNQKLCFDKFDIKFIINSDLHYDDIPKTLRPRFSSIVELDGIFIFWGDRDIYYYFPSRNYLILGFPFKIFPNSSSQAAMFAGSY